MTQATEVNQPQEKKLAKNAEFIRYQVSAEILLCAGCYLNLFVFEIQLRLRAWRSYRKKRVENNDADDCSCNNFTMVLDKVMLSQQFSYSVVTAISIISYR